MKSSIMIVVPVVSLMSIIQRSNCLLSHAVPAIVHALGGPDDPDNRSNQPPVNITTECASTEWGCQVNHDNVIKWVCFPHNWVCDGHWDCADGSDEHQCDSWKEGCGSISQSCTGDDCKHDERATVCGDKLASLPSATALPLTGDEGNYGDTMVVLAVLSCVATVMVFLTVAFGLYRRRQGKAIMSWDRLNRKPVETVTMGDLTQGEMDYNRITQGQFVSIKSEIVRPKRSDLRASLTENMEGDEENA